MSSERALAEAASMSGLRRFCPFTSINRLCFAESSSWPFENVQPAFAFWGSEGEISVFAGSPFDETWDEELLTMRPEAAVEALVDLLLPGDHGGQVAGS